MMRLASRPLTIIHKVNASFVPHAALDARTVHVAGAFDLPIQPEGTWPQLADDGMEMYAKWRISISTIRKTRKKRNEK